MDPQKILLVEDDPFLKDIYREALINAGYSVVTAEEGYEALWKIRYGNWSLVLLDVVLPQITGVEILRKLKEINHEDLIKMIVVLTNTDDDKDLNDIKAFTDKILIKSNMGPADLVKKIQDYLPK